MEADIARVEIEEDGERMGVIRWELFNSDLVDLDLSSCWLLLTPYRIWKMPVHLKQSELSWQRVDRAGDTGGWLHLTTEDCSQWHPRWIAHWCTLRSHCKWWHPGCTLVQIWKYTARCRCTFYIALCTLQSLTTMLHQSYSQHPITIVGKT